jgi:hypothetical protein
MSLTPAAQQAVSAIKSGAASQTSLLDVAFGSGGKGAQTTDPDNAARSADSQEAVEINDHSVNELANEDISDPDAPADADDGEEQDAEVADEDAEEADSDEEQAADEGKKAKGKKDVEKIKVAGQEIEIDYSDKEATKRAHIQAAGMRKFQKERDDARAEATKLKESQKPLEDDAHVGRTLGDAWDKGGIKGLVETLTKGKQTWDQLVDAEIENRKKLAAMSPAERAAHERAQDAERKAAEAERREREYQDKLKKIDERAENAERAELQTAMKARAEKYTFTGKLGDAADETRLNRMLWRNAQAELAEMLEGFKDDDTVPPDLIERAWAESYKALNRTVERRVREETSDTLKTKKAEAKSAAQSQMKRGGKKPTSREQSLRDSMRSGDVKGGIVAWLRGQKK